MTEQEIIRAILQMGVGRTNLGISKESQVIFQALKKQIPKTPIYKNMYKKCPTCGAIRLDLGKYCMACGQKIDWGNENDRAD